ncbi:MAG: hypothetical protein ACOH5I_09240 [Oligoflexus sp.]
MLYFGCDHPDVDFLYHEELQSWERAGIVSIRASFCRAPINGQTYVQDRIWDERQEICDMITSGAHIYVCGDGRSMAPSVRETFVRIYQERHSCSDEQSNEWLNDMRRSFRYMVDVFG